MITSDCISYKMSFSASNSWNGIHLHLILFDNKLSYPFIKGMAEMAAYGLLDFWTCKSKQNLSLRFPITFRFRSPDWPWLSPEPWSKALMPITWTFWVIQHPSSTHRSFWSSLVASYFSSHFLDAAEQSRNITAWPLPFPFYWLLFLSLNWELESLHIVSETR